MPEVKPWLSLKVSNRLEPGNYSIKASLLVSIPKKSVRLATQRNRIKRLIREVFRNKSGLDPEKVYAFRVNQYPGDIGLKEAEKIMNQAIDESATE